MCLEHADLRAEIDPRAGAALLVLQSQRGGHWQDWLVDEGLAASIGTPACFPLIPFANRVAYGALEQSSARLVANRPDLSAHPIHGYAWQAPWQVDDRDAQSLQLSYDGSDDPWPWQYRAALSVVLAPRELRIQMSLINLGSEAMPAGLGLHPAFPSKDLLGVTAETTAFLPVTDTGLPDAYMAGAQECADLAAGVLPYAGMDSDFDGWRNSVRMEWSDRVLELSSDPVFAALHVFRPVAKPLLCLEPVTHLTGAMATQRLPDIPAPPMLKPAEELAGSIIFRLLQP